MFAADCLISLLSGEKNDQAQIGALLIAEALRTIRDWDLNNFKRKW